MYLFVAKIFFLCLALHSLTVSDYLSDVVASCFNIIFVNIVAKHPALCPDLISGCLYDVPPFVKVTFNIDFPQTKTNVPLALFLIDECRYVRMWACLVYHENKVENIYLSTKIN